MGRRQTPAAGRRARLCRRASRDLIHSWGRMNAHRKLLKPGRKGARELVVRYRYDEERREELMGVELVVRRRGRERGAGRPGSLPAGGLIGGASHRRVEAEHLGLRRGWSGERAWIDVDGAAASEMSRFRPQVPRSRNREGAMCLDMDTGS